MGIVADLVIGLRFFSRLPVPMPRRATEAAGLAGAAAMAPLAGAIIGLFPAVVLLLALALAVPPIIAATLGIAMLVAVTGALHEDGLADVADGFGGGRTRERKLEIMRDSRIGTFGACALVLSLFFRVTALGALAASSGMLGAAALVAAAAASRTACLMPLVLLPPARADGAGASAGRPSPVAIVIAGLLAIAIGLAVLAANVSLGRIASAVVLAAISGLAVCALAWRQIGGHTGDVAGAAQQVAEIAVYLVLAAHLPSA